MEAAATCGPSGTTLHITAKGTAFDTDCLTAPANTPFTIEFANRDSGINHNVAIYTADPIQNPNAKTLFKGTLVTGLAMMTYDMGALPPGTYHFHCDVHEAKMFGTFVVK